MLRTFRGGILDGMAVRCRRCGPLQLTYERMHQTLKRTIAAAKCLGGVKQGPRPGLSIPTTRATWTGSTSNFLPRGGRSDFGDDPKEGEIRAARRQRNASRNCRAQWSTSSPATRLEHCRRGDQYDLYSGGRLFIAARCHAARSRSRFCARTPQQQQGCVQAGETRYQPRDISRQPHEITRK